MTPITPCSTFEQGLQLSLRSYLHYDALEGFFLSKMYNVEAYGISICDGICSVASLQME